MDRAALHPGLSVDFFPKPRRLWGPGLRVPSLGLRRGFNGKGAPRDP